MKAKRPSKMSLMVWVALAVFNCITVPYIGRGWLPPHDFDVFYSAAQVAYLHAPRASCMTWEAQAASSEQRLYVIPDRSI